MKYTVIGYMVLSGQSHSETCEATSATEAVKIIMRNLCIEKPEHFEVIGVAKGPIEWDSNLDLTQIHLFP